jgi:hypothetical protein
MKGISKGFDSKEIDEWAAKFWREMQLRKLYFPIEQLGFKITID